MMIVIAVTVMIVAMDVVAKIVVKIANVKNVDVIALIQFKLIVVIIGNVVSVCNVVQLEIF